MHKRLTKDERKACRGELIRYVVPAILSYVSIFFFTVVDGIFTGRGVSTEALSSVNIVFPYIMIFTALLMLVTVGGLTVCAIRMGRGDTEGANRVFRIAVLVSGIFSALMALVGTLFTGPIIRLMGATATFYDMAYDYLFWYCVFLLPCGMGTVMAGFCRNDNSPVLVSISTLVSTGLNIFGDWLFIYPLQMGTKGAALATGIAQTIGLLILLVLHFGRKKGVLRFGRIEWEKGILPKLAIRGLPECVAQFQAPLSIIFMNVILGRVLGDSAVNAFAVIGYVASFAVAAFAGVSEGLQPLFGRCYGARKEQELHYYLWRGLIIGIAGAVLIIVSLYPLGEPVCRLYGVDAATQAMTLYAMPRYDWGFMVQAVNVIISSYLYSTTHSAQALSINVARSFVFNTLVTFSIVPLFGSDAIWFSYLAAEALALVLTVILWATVEKKGILVGARE